MVVNGIIIFAVRNVLGYLFVSDKDVVRQVAAIAVLAAIYQPADGLFGSTSGVLRCVRIILQASCYTSV